MKPHYFAPVLALCVLAVLSINASAANITWQPSFSVAVPTDIKNPAGGVLVAALDFNTAAGFATAGGDNMINGIPFTQSPAAGTGAFTTTFAAGPNFTATFTNIVSGDQDLDDLLDSHSWIAGNPGTATFTISGLTAGNNYQVQLIGVGDQRTCCAGRIYEPDDGAGAFTTGVTVQRGLVQSTIGTFTANATTQVITWRSLNAAAGNNDPGLSGVVVFALPTGDSDGDGLPDLWETTFGLDPNDNGLNPNNNGVPGNPRNGAQGDPDGEGLVNIDEFNRGTKPNDPDTDADGYNDRVETNSGTFVAITTDTGTHPLRADTDSDGLRDGVETNTGLFVDANDTGTHPLRADTDTDGLPDGYEVTHMFNPHVNDANGDPDDDMSSNLAEFTRGTNPRNPDTDADGYKDGIESNSGTFVDLATDTGTNPLNADTDGDGLRDGVETNTGVFVDAMNTGTSPLRVDSDGDLFSDGFEVANGSNPTVAGSRPTANQIRPIAGLLGGDLTDPENDGIEGPTIPGPPQTAGTNFNWVSINASSENYFHNQTGVGEGAFDVFDNTVGAGGAKWCCDGPPQWITVEFANPVSITHFTLTSSNDTPDRDARDWQILGSNDGVTFSPIFTQVGDPQLWTARNQTLLFVLGAPSLPYLFIRYDVTRTNGVNHALNEIEYFGTVGATDIRITNVTYDKPTDFTTLTWTSLPGRIYTVFYSLDLMDFGADVTDSVSSGGDSTTLGFQNPIPGAEKMFFKVKQN